MKDTTFRNKKLFEEWKKGKSFSELSNLEIKGELSLKRVRNIIYGGVKSLKSNYEKEIYIAFIKNCLKRVDMAEMIRETFLNQPPYKLSEKRIRQIINKELRELKTKN